MIKHHPKAETLAEFAAGTLDEGRALVVVEHVTRCKHCQRFVSGMEQVGGQMLMRAEPAAMSADARDRAISRLDGLEKAAKPAASAGPLDAYPLGPWRWIAPGLRWRSVKMPEKTPTRVFLLKAAPGTKLPSHSHTGTELTTVLAGAFIHSGGHFGAGDCDDADQDVAHSPVVDVGEECICIVAMQGTIRLQGTLGRLIQPFIRL